jgi:hypothetical protein
LMMASLEYVVGLLTLTVVVTVPPSQYLFTCVFRGARGVR